MNTKLKYFLAALGAAAVVGLSGCGDDADEEATEEVTEQTDAAEEQAEPATDEQAGDAGDADAGDAEQAGDAAEAEQPATDATTEQPTDATLNMVKLTTSLGEIEIELDREAAPVSAENFAQYVRDGHFNDLIFHRVIPGFMIQGGGFTADMQQRPTREAIVNEADNGLKNLAGTLAMARTSDPNSATSQFFINLVDNGFLDHTEKTQAGWGYAVLGKVVKGMEVVEAIGATETSTQNGFADVPVTPVVITAAEMVGQ